jgi:peptidyl-prolyl cis-trans isomerase C
VSQILLSSEQEAQEVAKRLESNESFERIAQEKSMDKPSAAQGGKLGWLLPTMIVKPLDDIILSLKKGNVSNPVQTNLGWHILKVDDVRKFKPASYDDAKTNVIKGLMDAKRKVLVEELAKTSVIK